MPTAPREPRPSGPSSIFPPDVATVGGRLAAVRRAAGKTQAQLAAALGCSQVVVAKVESGASIPSPEWTARAAAALAVPSEAIDDRVDHLAGRLSLAADAAGRLDGLTEADRATLDRLAVARPIRGPKALAAAMEAARAARLAVILRTDLAPPGPSPSPGD